MVATWKRFRLRTAGINSPRTKPAIETRFFQGYDARGQRVHPCAELEVDRLLRRRWQSQSPKAQEIDSNVAGRLVRLAGMKIYRGFAERLHHKVPHWVEPGALFHIRIRLEHEKEQKALTDPAVAQAILDSAKFYQATMRWHITLFLLMPDHLHAVLSFARDKSMSELIRGRKRFHKRTNHVIWQALAQTKKL